MEVRRRNVEPAPVEEKRDFYETIRHFDAFTKVKEEAVVESTITGGFFSALAFSVMGILFLCEIWIWVMHTQVKYDFDVDVDFDAKLNLNFDITVNTPCFGIGADIRDSSGDQYRYMVQIKEEDVDFELEPRLEQQRIQHLEMKQRLHDRGVDLHKTLLREGYDTGHLERAKLSNEAQAKAARQRGHVIAINFGSGKKACRFWGSVPLHKVSGMFQIQSGKTVPGEMAGIFGGMGNVRMDFFGGPKANFTHRIDHFSFGEPSSGLVYPLDGDMIYQSGDSEEFNYIINVVPTRLRTIRFKSNTYQYAVTQHTKKTEAGQGGIFIKYDFAGLGVEVTESREKITSLVTRLCGILGGIFASSGILSSLISFLSISVQKSRA